MLEYACSVDVNGEPGGTTGTVTVNAVLFCAPVEFSKNFLTTHDWDWVEADMPLADKPTATMDVPLDATLAEVIDCATTGWGLVPGKHLREIGSTRTSQVIAKVAFVRAGEEAPEGGSRREWTYFLPVARLDGAVEQRAWVDVTYRELLAASSLGLVRGDVTRPYVHPVPPQGDPAAILEVGRLAVDAIRAAYDALPDARGVEHGVRLVEASLPPTRHLIDDAMRVAFVGGTIRAAWRRLKRRSKRR
jgi:hypothetical protein